jgi:hypothetical protein
MAASYEKTLAELPRERAAAIEQVDRTVDARTRSAIEQMDRAVDTRITSAIAQSAAAVAAERQHTLAAAEAGSRRLMDRMAILLTVVIAVGAVAIACVVYAFRRLSAKVAAAAAARETSPPAGPVSFSARDAR